MNADKLSPAEQEKRGNEMRYPGHKIIKCSNCSSIELRCRCMDANKAVEYIVGCPKCPPTQVKFEDLPIDLRKHIVERGIRKGTNE